MTLRQLLDIVDELEHIQVMQAPSGYLLFDADKHYTSYYDNRIVKCIRSINNTLCIYVD